MHSNWHTAIQEYSVNMSTPEDPFLQAIHEFTWKKMINPRMLSEHLQGLLLSQLVAIHQPSKILEIGTFTGYATACLLKYLKSQGELFTIEADAETLYKTREFWKIHKKDHLVHWIHGDATQVLAHWEPESIDFIFVDADKTNYQEYLKLCIPLLRTNGVLLFDNTLWSNRVVNEADRKLDRDTKNMHDFNQFAKNQAGFETVLLPIRDGLTLMRKH